MLGDFSVRKVEDWVRLSAAHAFTALFFILNIVAWPHINDGMFKPHLVLIVLFYWTVYRPTLVPPLYCFLLGLGMDMLLDTPPGLFAGLFVLLHWVIRDQRRFLTGQPYIVIWAVFGLVGVTFSFLQWGLMGLANGFHWDAPVPALLQAVITFLTFPFITMLLIAVHRILPVTAHGRA